MENSVNQESWNVHSSLIYTACYFSIFINMKSLLTLSLAAVACKCHQYSGRPFKESASTMQAV